ncbi:MAG: PKD domain-containing protein, partial [Bacteroidetes bacterium]|nr:PKD domain-containing protein [Bacteroidota bacterium]
VSKLSPGLDTRIFSTAFGTGLGKPNISPTAFLVDVCEKIYLDGWGGTVNLSSAPNSASTSGMFVTSNALQPTTDGSDFYLMVLEDDASAVHYATFYGGNGTPEHVDGGTSRFDRKGKIYQTACACGGPVNTNFPVYADPSPYAATNGSSNCNSAVFKIDLQLPIMIADFETPQPACAPASINFVNRSTHSPTTTYAWDFGDGNGSALQNPTHTYISSGVFIITLIATDNSSCNFADTLKKQVVILSNTSYDLPSVQICQQGTAQIGVAPINNPVITYQWTPAAGLSAANVPNPFATLTSSTQYQLVISNGVCADTIRQWVNLIPQNIATSPDTIICSPGQITIWASSGNGVYQNYQWSNNSNFSNTLNAAPSDTFAVVNITASQIFYIKAVANGCVSIDSVNVQLQTDTVYTLPIVEICEGNASTIGIASQPGFAYSWSPSQGLNNANISNPVASPVSTVNYTLNISKGVCADTVFQTVDVTPLAPLTVIEDSTICKGNAITLTASTNGLYQNYVWSTNNSFTDTLNNPISNSYVTVSPVANQLYFIKTFQGPCMRIDSVKVSVLKDTLYTIPGFQVCINDSVSLGAGITIDPDLTYTWQPSAGLSNSNIPNPNAAPSQSITYLLIMDNGTCADSVYQSVGVTDLKLFTSNDTLLCDKTPSIVSATSLGTSSNYAWSLNSGFIPLLNAIPTDTVVSFVPNQGNSWVFIKVEENGCSKTDSVNIELREVAINPASFNLCWSDTAVITAVSLQHR